MYKGQLRKRKALTQVQSEEKAETEKDDDDVIAIDDNSSDEDIFLPRRATRAFPRTRSQQAMPPPRSTQVPHVRRPSRCSRLPDPVDVDVPFPERHAPSTSEELGVHSAKIKEIRNWFTDRLDFPRNGNGLLLIGPSGCGKSAAVHAICCDLSLPVVTWEPAEQCEIGTDRAGEHVVRESPLWSQFSQWLRAADFLPGRACVLVDGLPEGGTARETTELISSCLRTRLPHSRQLFVFCMSSSEGASWETHPKRLFPDSLLSDLGMRRLEMNAVAATYLKKAVKRAAEREGTTLEKNDLDAIVSSADGDIRVALNELHLYLTGEGGGEGAVGGGAEKKRNPHYDLFHSVGRILYAKRLPESSEEWQRGEDALLDESRRRPQSERSVQEILDGCTTNRNTLSLYIHEHCVSFSPSLSALRAQLDAMSLADSLTREGASSSRWEVRTTAEEMFQPEIVIRSTMFHNYGAHLSGKMKAFSKERWSGVKKESADLRARIAQESGQPLVNSYFQEVIPMLGHMPQKIGYEDLSTLGYLSRPMSIARSVSADDWVEQYCAARSRLTSRGPQPSQVLSSQSMEQCLDEEPVIEDSDDDWDD